MNKNPIRENDIYKSDEYQKIDEYQHFPAEQYHSKELIPNKMEDYKSEEFKKVSFTNEENKKNKKKEDKAFDKIKNFATNTSSTVATTVTVSAVAVVGAITIGFVPLFNPKPIQIEGSPLKESIRSEISTKLDNELGVRYYLDNLYLYFIDEAVQENYNANATLIDADNKTYVGEVDFINKQIRFHDFFIDINSTSYKVSVEIFDQNKNSISNYTSNPFDISYNYELRNDGVFEHAVDFNKDNTSNIYFYRLNNNIVTNDDEVKYKEVVQIIDENGSVIEEHDINDINNIDNQYFWIENIPYNNYTFANKTYILNNSSMYLLSSNYIYDISYDVISDRYFDVSQKGDGLYFKTLFRMYNTITGTLTYLNSNQSEQIVLDNFSSSFHHQFYFITPIENKAIYEATISTNLYDSPSFDYYSNKFGLTDDREFHNYNVSKEITFVDGELSVDLVEFSLEEYPSLRFEGNIEDNVIQVDVIDSSGNIVATESVYSVTSPLLISNLVVDELYTFSYYLVDQSGVEIDGTRKTYQSTINNEYFNNVHYENSYPNPSNIPIHINDDYTYNIIIDTGFKNNSDEDLYFEVGLDGDEYFAVKTKEPIVKLYNLDTTYGVTYCAYIDDLDDPIKRYAAKEKISVSGVVFEDIKLYLEDGYYSSSYLSYINIENQHYLTTIREVIGDIHFTIICDDDQEQTYEGIIPSSEFTYGEFFEYGELYSCSFDISEYNFTNRLTFNYFCPITTYDNEVKEMIKDNNFNIGKNYVIEGSSFYIYK